jgi:hypothetical protein
MSYFNNYTEETVATDREGSHTYTHTRGKVVVLYVVMTSMSNTFRIKRNVLTLFCCVEPTAISTAKQRMHPTRYTHGAAVPRIIQRDALFCLLAS